jgi:hypothetical protein
MNWVEVLRDLHDFAPFFTNLLGRYVLLPLMNTNLLGGYKNSFAL